MADALFLYGHRYLINQLIAHSTDDILSNNKIIRWILTFNE